jgi:hypothetical protein
MHFYSVIYPEIPSYKNEYNATVDIRADALRILVSRLFDGFEPVFFYSNVLRSALHRKTPPKDHSSENALQR